MKKALRSPSEKGFALLFVLSIIILFVAFLQQILLDAQITAQSASSSREIAQAETNAYTGAEFARLVIALDLALQNASENPQSLGMPLPPGIVQSISSQLGPLGFAGLLNGKPLGKTALETLSKAGNLPLNKLMDEKLIVALSTVNGYFEIQVSDESTKINLNVSRDPSHGSANHQALLRLFSTQKEARLLEIKGITPQKLAAAAADWVTTGNASKDGSSDKSALYSPFRFAHKPKNAPYESLDELRRVPGFHIDEVFALFSPYLTAWPRGTPQDPSLNTNRLPTALVAALMTEPGKEPNEEALDEWENRLRTGSLFTRKQDITDWFKQKFATDSDNTSREIVSHLFGVHSNVYRVEVRGVTPNGLERKLVQIVERGTLPQYQLPALNVQKATRVVWSRLD